MSVVSKIILFVLVVIGLLIGGGVYLQKQMTPQRVREYLIPLLETSLDRKVALGKVEIGLLSGITVYDLVIKQQDSADDFLTVRRVDLYYEWWPLLTGRFVVNQVALDQPAVSVFRQSDGQYNFSDLVNSKQQKRASYRDKSVAVANELFSVLVKKVTIQGGSLSFVDAKENSKTPYRYKLSQLNLNVRDLNFEQAFPFDLSLRFNDAQLDLSGHYDFALNSGDLLVHLSSLDLIPLAPYYRQLLPGKLGAGKLTLNVEADFQPGQLSSKGKISVADFDFSAHALRRVAIKDIDVSADYSIVFDRRTRQLNIATLLLKLADIGMTLDGNIDLAAPSPVLDMVLWLNKVDLRSVLNSVPASLMRDYRKYSLAGIVDGRVTLQGSVDKPGKLFRSAQLSLDDVQLSTEHLRLGLAGEISYLNDSFKTDDLSLSYGNQTLQLRVDARKGGGGIFKGTFTLAADVFDCNEVLGAAHVSGTSSTGINAEAGSEIGSFDLPLDLVGSLTANSVKYRNLVLDHVYADAQVHNNRLRLQNISINFGNGRIKGESNLNLGVPGLAYSGDVQLDDIDLSALYEGLYPNGIYHLSGTMRLDTTFSGYGTRKTSVLKALNMQGSVRVNNGVVRGFPVIDSVADFVGGDGLRDVTFRSLHGQYQVANNIIHQNSQLEGSQLRIASQGIIDLGSYVNFKLDTRVAPRVLRRSGAVADALAMFIDDQGWGMIPLEVQGYLGDLKVRPDAAVIKQKVADKAKQEVLNNLSEQLNKNDSVQEGVQEMLDNTLNKLFGK